MVGRITGSSSRGGGVWGLPFALGLPRSIRGAWAPAYLSASFSFPLPLFTRYFGIEGERGSVVTPKIPMCSVGVSRSMISSRPF